MFVYVVWWVCVHVIARRLISRSYMRYPESCLHSFLWRKTHKQTTTTATTKMTTHAQTFSNRYQCLLAFFSCLEGSLSFVRSHDFVLLPLEFCIFIVVARNAALPQSAYECLSRVDNLSQVEWLSSLSSRFLLFFSRMCRVPNSDLKHSLICQLKSISSPQFLARKYDILLLLPLFLSAKRLANGTSGEGWRTMVDTKVYALISPAIAHT